jgi:inosine-uridine nucleoside N-ribohydrolase
MPKDIREVYADIKSDRVKKFILDTDTYNEVDDQFAVAYAMLADKIDLLSLNAAPFHNNRSTSPADGMEKSYNEIVNITTLTDPVNGPKIPKYKGSTTYLPNAETPVDSPAADNIIDTVMSSDELVYVAAIGAITNVASAILKCPEIINKMAVIWLGGHAWNHHYTREFNMVQDVPAAQVIFNCGVPFVQLPAVGVTSVLTITAPDLEAYLRGHNKLCDYLTDIVETYTANTYCWTKVIWDISAVACLQIPKAFDAVITATPVLSRETTYWLDQSRHPMIYVRGINRDAVFTDLFKKLTAVK